ncbi:peptidase M48 [Wenjunlia vitaminophila]|uniref:Peptidase M48 n=1 Tax=Wenjunlia vitaminophila TaxID=76728 RepID=A0A0T6LUT6_WENVI|nr:peptidase M48 [Wenjunlia vitaminophila]
MRRAQWPPVLAGRAVWLAVLLGLGLSPAGEELVSAAPGAWWVEAAVGTVGLVLLGQAVRLPFSARVRVVRHRFGLVTQGWAGWWADVLRGLLITLPLAVAVVVGVYALARALPDTWWVVAAAAAAVLSVLLSWLAPVLLEPVFNRFTPMPQGELRTELLRLAERDGIPVRDVLVADASRRTSALNAYVSGFGATRRVVVHDTLLTAAEPEEVTLVVAHELGHVKHRDVPRGTALGALGAAAGVCLLAAATRWEPLLDLAGVDRFQDPGSLVLLAALASTSAALAGPVGCAVSRRVESRADRHALELTGDPDRFIAMQRRLSVSNVADVDPPRLLHALFGTHPSATQRIAAARAFAARGSAGPR